MTDLSLAKVDTVLKPPAPRASPRVTAIAPLLGNQARLQRLAIGAVDDPLEREADAAAEQVMRMADPALSHGAPPRVSRKCAGCEEELHRAGDGSGAHGGSAPPIVHQALRDPGRPLESGARAFMEAGFGADFSTVRVHTGALAARSAREVGAHAYAVGQDIVFADGRYDPASESGRRVIAHELAHTLQQSDDGTVRRSVVAPSPADATEVAGYINGFCPGGAVASGSSVTPATGECKAGGVSAGCDCACTAMNDTTRTYTIMPLACDLNATKETVGGVSTVVNESSVWPSTSGPACAANVTIKIPKAGSAMEFGAFDAKGGAFWYDTPRILGHELCGHGVACQTYQGGTGNRPQHNSTIDTENQLFAPPTRGHFTDKRQGEAFTNKAGDHTKIAFKQTDGWHFEAP